MTKWFLILAWYTCNSGGIDPGIIPGNCGNREIRVEMPSLEACRQVRGVNQGSRCLTEDIDPTPPPTSGMTGAMQAPWKQQ